MPAFNDIFENYSGREDQELKAPQPDPRTVLSTLRIATPPDAKKQYCQDMVGFLQKQMADCIKNSEVTPASQVADAFNQDSDARGVQEHNGLRA